MKEKSKLNRREFMNRMNSGAAGAGLTLLSSAASVKGTPANNKVNLAFCGCGGRGRQLLTGFLERSDINLISCCDPMLSRVEMAVKTAMTANAHPKMEQDFRKVLDDKSIDAIVSATPDHWHALITVLACQAGKDVYIEKPASHSAWEGQKMIEASRKYRRIVQLGTQNRSAPYNISAKKYIDEGKLGKIHFARIVNMKQWSNFDKKPVQKVPDGFNWDLWSGPAPLHDYSPTYVSGWHHFWDYSSGDIINDAIHQIDLCRWLIGKEFPKSAYSVGGRFNSTGACETPDTQMSTFEFDNMILTIELTLYTPYMLKTDPVVRQSDMFPYWMQNATRIEIYGDNGMMIAGRHGGGWEVYDRPKDRKPVVKASAYGRFPDPEHKENFLHCVRSREMPNADIEKGVRSTLLPQLATISYRLGGKKIDVDPRDGSIIGCPEAEPYYKRTYRAPFAVPENV